MPVAALVSIAKLDETKQVVYGIVLDPYIVDAHDDWTPPHEVQKTAWGWLAGGGKIRLQHSADVFAEAVESWLMPYPTVEDYAAALACQPHRVWQLPFGTELVHSGSWVLGTRVLDPAAWQAVLSGALQSYSIGGFGVRTEVGKVPMPEVTVLKIEVPTP